MSKLFKLKVWLTIPEAAKYLSAALSEDVSDADVLRLGLDGHIKLSVHFLNMAWGKQWVPVTIEDVEWELYASPDGDMIRSPKNGTVWVSQDDTRQLSTTIQQLDAEAWDLPMIGAEEITVRTAFNSLMNLPVVEYNVGHGACVASLSGDLFQLQYVHTDEHRVGSWNPDWGNHDNFYPAEGLPYDSTLIVRTAVLVDFISGLSDSQHPQQKERTSYLNIIGGLLEIMLGKSPSGVAHSVFDGQSAIIDSLVVHFPDKPGLSKRNLEAKFAEGKRSLHST